MPAIALLDLDGTLADHDSALKRDMDAIAGPSDYPFVPGARYGDGSFMQNRIDLIRRQPGWWENLQPIPQSMQLVDLLRKMGFCLHILTKGPSSKSLAWKEKVDWVRQYVPDAEITITEDKGLVYGRVLVDDYPPYAEKWLKHRPRGLVIMPANSSNESYEHGQSIIKFRGTINFALAFLLYGARHRKSKETIAECCGKKLEAFNEWLNRERISLS
jgi:hypothetical protein